MWRGVKVVVVVGEGRGGRGGRGGRQKMNPNWDPETMPDWNKTTECERWDEDYVPCRFPYTGKCDFSG